MLSEAMLKELSFHAAEPVAWAFRSSKWRKPQSLGTARLLATHELLEARRFSELAERGKPRRIHWVEFAITDKGRDVLEACNAD